MQPAMRWTGKESQDVLPGDLDAARMSFNIIRQSKSLLKSLLLKSTNLPLLGVK